MILGSRARRDVADPAAKPVNTARKETSEKAGQLSPPEDVVSDDELARRLRKGDDNAWDILARRLSSFVYSRCWRSTGNSAIAEELAQEVWNKLWNYRKNIRDGGFVALVEVITANTCRDYGRRAEHRYHVHLAEGQELPDISDKGVYVNLDDDIDRKGLVEKLLARLPPREREVLLMRDVEDMSYKAIGAALGHSHATARTIHLKAIAIIRAFLSGGEAV